MKPLSSEHPIYYQKYIDLVPTENLIEALQANQKSTLDFMLSFPSAKENYQYAEGKWAPKQVLLHIMDGERIFNYRALAFARGEQQSLPGFDENNYAANDNAANRSFESIIEEYKILRADTICLFKNFSETQLTKIGMANNNPVSVRAIGFFTVGHETHHLNVIRERYLKN